MYPKIILKPGREKSLFYKHPWIFSGAIDTAEPRKIYGDNLRKNKATNLKSIEDGMIVDVTSIDGRLLARGYYNSQSNIAIRILTFEENELIDENFLERRLRRAQKLRENFIDHNQTNAYRLVFAESDGLPGLIIDAYDDILVLQIHTLGMEKMKHDLVQALIKVFTPRIIYERSDVNVRKQEGLRTLPVGILHGSFNGELVKIRENGLEFLVDIVQGQKTGFFLDQRENREGTMAYVKGKRVLNLFSYSGGFSCYSLRGGAKFVTSVDISSEAIDLCNKNVALNGFGHDYHEAVVADVFEYLEKSVNHVADKSSNSQKFDVVIVDPPAFVKSAKNLKNALKAYARLNEMALRVLAKNGILISSSCSSYVTPEMFRGALFQAALRTKDDLVILEQRTQPADHPNRLYFPEGEYLKFFVLKKTNSTEIS